MAAHGLVLRRAARSTSTRCAAGRTAWSRSSPAASRASPSSARSTVVRGTGTFTSLNQLEVDRGRRLGQDRELRAGDHRRRLRAGDAAVHPARRPAGDRLHRRAGAGRHAEAAAGARRRDHRAGDGDRLLRARREGDHRRADGPDHPGRRQGHRHAAHQADRQAVREHLPQDQGDQGRGRTPTGCACASRAAAPPRPTPSTRSWSRSGGGPTAS